MLLLCCWCCWYCYSSSCCCCCCSCYCTCYSTVNAVVVYPGLCNRRREIVQIHEGLHIDWQTRETIMRIGIECQPGERIVSFEHKAQHIRRQRRVQWMIVCRLMGIGRIEYIVGYLYVGHMQMQCCLEEHRTHILQMRTGGPEPGGHATRRRCGDHITHRNGLLVEGTHLEIDRENKLVRSEERVPSWGLLTSSTSCGGVHLKLLPPALGQLGLSSMRPGLPWFETRSMWAAVRKELKAIRKLQTASAPANTHSPRRDHQCPHRWNLRYPLPRQR